MSLKAFHILFVAVSVMLTVGFGVWGVREYVLRSDRGSLALGLLSFAAAAALVVYGRWFLKKLKGTGYL